MQEEEGAAGVIAATLVQRLADDEAELAAARVLEEAADSEARAAEDAAEAAARQAELEEEEEEEAEKSFLTSAASPPRDAVPPERRGYSPAPAVLHGPVSEQVTNRDSLESLTRAGSSLSDRGALPTETTPRAHARPRPASAFVRRDLDMDEPGSEAPGGGSPLDPFSPEAGPMEARSKMREKLSKAMDFSGSAKRLDTYVDETP